MQTDDSNLIIQGPPKPQAAEPKKKKTKRPRFRSPRQRLVRSVLRLVVLGYAAILLTLVLMETRIVYPGAYFKDSPARETPDDPAIEIVEYDSTDGLTLRGRLIQRPHSENVVLFLHGNGTKAKWLDRWLHELSDQFDATTLIAEYRGYDDDVTPDEKGVLADCFAARDYLCNRYQKTPAEIILYGQSLGGGCAVALAAQGGAKALVLERTFDRLVNVAGAKYPIIPVNWLMKNRYDSIAKLTVYKGPLIMLHGTTDNLIPIDHAENLYSCAACEQKHMIKVDGLGTQRPASVTCASRDRRQSARVHRAGHRDVAVNRLRGEVASTVAIVGNFSFEPRHDRSRLYGDFNR